jgi:hypothetical protein
MVAERGRGGVWQRVRWAGGCLALVLSACDDDSCRSADCPRSCGRDGGCKVNEWCSSEDDCQAGLACLLTRGEGLFGPYSEHVCVYPPGAAGEPCATLSESQSGMATCLAGATCLFGRHARVAVGGAVLGEESPEGTGVLSGASLFWADTRESDEYQLYSRGECVLDGMSTAGQTCLGRGGCSAGLVCNEGYVPSQCQPRSALGEPCATGGDCASGTCVPADVAPLDESISGSCARADASCDIRTDASCNHWFACGRCG